jgi:hypothetical protein
MEAGMKLRILGLSVLTLALVGCSEFSDRLSKTGSCQSFNGSTDSLSFSIVESSKVIEVGSTFDVDIKASYYASSSSTSRTDVNCTPDWDLGSTGAIQIEKNKVKAIKPGVVKLVAKVGGSGSAKSDYIWIAVTPKLTEVENNNGITVAQALAANAPIFGRISSGDVDYFKFEVPVGRSYQVTLKEDPEGSNDDPFSNYYDGTLYDEDDDYFGETNKVYVNKTGSVLKVYAAVKYGSSASFPYRISYDLLP